MAGDGDSSSGTGELLHAKLLDREKARDYLELWAADATSLGFLPSNPRVLLFYLKVNSCLRNCRQRC